METKLHAPVIVIAKEIGLEKTSSIVLAPKVLGAAIASAPAVYCVALAACYFLLKIIITFYVAVVIYLNTAIKIFILKSVLTNFCNL